VPVAAGFGVEAPAAYCQRSRNRQWPLPQNSGRRLPVPTEADVFTTPAAKTPRATQPDDRGLLLVNNIGQASAHASPLHRESTPHTGLETPANQLFEQGA